MEREKNRSPLLDPLRLDAIRGASGTGAAAIDAGGQSHGDGDEHYLRELLMVHISTKVAPKTRENTRLT